MRIAILMDPALVRYPVRVADKQRAVAEAPRRFVELGTWFECPLHPIEPPSAGRSSIDLVHELDLDVRLAGSK